MSYFVKRKTPPSPPAGEIAEIKFDSVNEGETFFGVGFKESTKAGYIYIVGGTIKASDLFDSCVAIKELCNQSLKKAKPLPHGFHLNDRVIKKDAPQDSTAFGHKPGTVQNIAGEWIDVIHDDGVVITHHYLTLRRYHKPAPPAKFKPGDRVTVKGLANESRGTVEEVKQRDGGGYSVLVRQDGAANWFYENYVEPVTDAFSVNDRVVAYTGSKGVVTAVSSSGAPVFQVLHDPPSGGMHWYKADELLKMR